jgi:CRP/FNR family cyclic AMP-dependent transcriptional regulator
MGDLPNLSQNFAGHFSNEHTRVLTDGELVFDEGHEGRDLYIIQEGRVRIAKRTPVGSLDLATFERGEFFGDMALLQGIPRFASAHAVGPTRLLVLQPGGFLLKIRRDPTFAFEMLQQLSMRVKVSNERLFAALKKGHISQQDAQDILTRVEGVRS